MSRSTWSLASTVLRRRGDPTRERVRTTPRTSYASGPSTGPVSQFIVRPAQPAIVHDRSHGSHGSNQAAGPDHDVEHPQRGERRAVLGDEPSAARRTRRRCRADPGASRVPAGPCTRAPSARPSAPAARTTRGGRTSGPCCRTAGPARDACGAAPSPAASPARHGQRARIVQRVVERGDEVAGLVVRPRPDRPAAARRDRAAAAAGARSACACGRGRRATPSRVGASRSPVHSVAGSPLVTRPS